MTSSLNILERVLKGDLSWASSEDWRPQDVVDAADEHGVAALVADALQSVTAPAAALRDALEPSVARAVARDLLVRRELARLLGAMDAAGVPALVIKGSALAYTVYQHPWERQRTDTDLIVHPGMVAAASRVLETFGYSKSNALTSGTLVSHQLAFERQDAHGLRHVIDLHWKIVNPQILADVAPFDELWLDRLPAPALAPTAWVPSLVDSTMLACIHRLAHHQGQDRLIWLWDLKVLTAAYGPDDWGVLADRARRRRVAGLCLDGLLQSRERVGVALPERAEAALRQAAPGEPSHRYLEGAVHRRDVLASDLGALPSWKDRLRLLREHAFPPPEFIRERYGVRSSFLLPVLYVHRLVTGAVKWVRS
jgi:hypothetical protein